jgi:hypothetical protein
VGTRKRRCGAIVGVLFKVGPGFPKGADEIGVAVLCSQKGLLVAPKRDFRKHAPDRRELHLQDEEPMLKGKNE